MLLGIDDRCRLIRIALHTHAAAITRGKTTDDAAERGFPRTVCANQRVNLSGIDLKIHATQYGHGVALVQVGYGE